MKSALFFIMLGSTVCTSLWAASVVGMQYASRAQYAKSRREYARLLSLAISSFWLVAFGPLSLLIIILTHKK